MSVVKSPQRTEAFVIAQIKDGAVVVPDVDVDVNDDTPSTTKYTVSLAASPSEGGSVTGAGSYAAGTSVNISARC